MKNNPVKLAVHFPGQATKKGPDVESLKGHPMILSVVNQVYDTFVAAVSEEFGTNAPGEVLTATESALKENTFLAQLRSFYESMTYWMVLMKASFNGEPSLEQLVSERTMILQLAGHSLGGAVSKYAPGPGQLEEQLNNIHVGTRSIGHRAIPMLDTPHTYEEGGMAAVIGLRGWQVNKMLASINKRSGHGVPVLVANHNAPKIKIVAGPRKGLDDVSSAVRRTGGKFSNVTNYWFHHPIMQQASMKYWAFLGKPDAMPEPYPLFKYVSYVSGTELPPDKFRQDMAEGVWKPVHYNTLRGPSVHGAAHKNGFYNAVVFTQENVSWLRDSKRVRPHPVRDLDSIVEFKTELMRIVNGEVPAGKLKVAQPRPDAPALVYQAV